jgi:hypothetical protein
MSQNEDQILSFLEQIEKSTEEIRKYNKIYLSLLIYEFLLCFFQPYQNFDIQTYSNYQILSFRSYADERSIQKALKALQDFLSDKIIKSIEGIFKQLNVKLRTFEEYENIVSLHGGLINLVSKLTVGRLTHRGEHQTSNMSGVEDPSNYDLKNDKTGEQLISQLSNLKHMANNIIYSKIIGFMRYFLNAPNKKEILFSNVLTEERINKRYRKLTLYFHPDKNIDHDIPDVLRKEYITLRIELFKCASELKKSLFKESEESSNNHPQTLHEEEANKFRKIAIDYRNAHKAQWEKLKLFKKENLREIPSEELKIKSTNYGLLAYEKYRAACKLADNNKQLKSQIKLRSYMALSLYICDKFMEAQLYALAAVSLVIRNSTNATQQDLYEAKETFDKVNRGNPNGSGNTQLNTEIKPKNSSYNSRYALVKTETLVNKFAFLEKKDTYHSINDDLEKICIELMLKAGRRSVRDPTNEEEILLAKCYETSGIGHDAIRAAAVVSANTVCGAILGASSFSVHKCLSDAATNAAIRAFSADAAGAAAVAGAVTSAATNTATNTATNVATKAAISAVGTVSVAGAVAGVGAGAGAVADVGAGAVAGVGAGAVADVGAGAVAGVGAGAVADVGAGAVADVGAGAVAGVGAGAVADVGAGAVADVGAGAVAGVGAGAVADVGAGAVAGVGAGAVAGVGADAGAGDVAM